MSPTEESQHKFDCPCGKRKQWLRLTREPIVDIMSSDCSHQEEKLMGQELI